MRDMHVQRISGSTVIAGKEKEQCITKPRPPREEQLNIVHCKLLISPKNAHYLTHYPATHQMNDEL